MIREIKLPKSCIQDCSHSGQCDSDVAYWLKQPKVAKQIDAIPAEQLARYLKEYGAWDEDELSDHDANKARILWLGAANCKENKITTFCVD